MRSNGYTGCSGSEKTSSNEVYIRERTAKSSIRLHYIGMKPELLKSHDELRAVLRIPPQVVGRNLVVQLRKFGMRVVAHFGGHPSLLRHLAGTGGMRGHVGKLLKFAICL